ncbi:hypothetical protein HDV05_007519 [Chytridiales sp. JEL 0842]|nr:hypothetical protein HDV05_007519 [Chytridiales sp. JEL 0842]
MIGSNPSVFPSYPSSTIASYPTDYDPNYSIWNDYDFLEECGTGVYGKVYKAQRKSDRSTVAIKSTPRDHCEGIDPTTYRELNALALFKNKPCQFVITLYDFKLNRDYVFFVMEFAEQDLHAFIRERRQVELPTVKHFTYQILIAVLELQKQGIMHRDLKPNNIMVIADSEIPYIKLIDFGLSRQTPYPMKPTTPEIQTVLYRAPEVFFQPQFPTFTENQRMLRLYSKKVDTWSVGCIMAGSTEIAVQKNIIEYAPF